jgi:hypothetical protein
VEGLLDFDEGLDEGKVYFVVIKVWLIYFVLVDALESKSKADSDLNGLTYRVWICLQEEGRFLEIRGGGGKVWW